MKKCLLFALVLSVLFLLPVTALATEYAFSELWQGQVLYGGDIVTGTFTISYDGSSIRHVEDGSLEISSGSSGMWTITGISDTGASLYGHYSLIIGAKAGGYVSPSSIDNSYLFQPITLQAIPYEGYHFVKWETSERNFAKTSNPVTFKMPSRTVTITAVFACDVHSFSDWEDVDGSQHRRTCSNCGYSEQSDHAVVTDEAVSPTCTDSGLTEGTHCSICGLVLQAQTEVLATGHSWKDATCTEAKTCTICGTTEGEPNGHTVVTDPAVAATCTETGLTEGSHCSACDIVFQAQETVPATGHVWNDAPCTEPRICSVCGAAEDAPRGHIWQDATCTEPKTCTVCGETEGEPNGHTIVTDPAAAATCDEAGRTEGSHCAVCGMVLEEQQEIPATGHTIVVDPAAPATCTEAGRTEGSHCTVCGKVLEEQQEIPATGHTIAVDPAVPATCAEPGLTEGSHCAVCGKVRDEQKETPVTGGHTIAVDPGVPATCTEAGLTEGSHCAVCGKVRDEQQEIPALGHYFAGWNPDGTGHHILACMHMCGYQEVEECALFELPPENGDDAPVSFCPICGFCTGAESTAVTGVKASGAAPHGNLSVFSLETENGSRYITLAFEDGGRLVQPENADFILPEELKDTDFVLVDAEGTEYPVETTDENGMRILNLDFAPEGKDPAAVIILKVIGE